MTTIQVVIPMAGLGDRFKRAGYTQPKPLLDVAGVPLIVRLLKNFPTEWRYVFICNRDQLKETNLREVLTKAVPTCAIAEIEPHKKGPVYTVLQAAAAIQDDLPTLMNYCDFSFRWDPNDFLKFVERTQSVGSIFCYRGFHPHYLRQTLYAYCREENGQVVEVREKGHFTPDRTKEYASSGTYYFASGAEMKRSFQKAMDSDWQINGEFYASLPYNALIAEGKRVTVYEIPFFLQWGTPEDLEDYLYWHRAFETWNKHVPLPRSPGVQLLMPMAGEGSRFDNYSVKKPLIPVLDQPMFKTAQRFLPISSDAPVLILRQDLEKTVREAEPEAKQIVLYEPTQGQADTTEKGVSALSLDKPVIVSSCDHGLLWDPAGWKRLLDQKPAMVIFGQRGYPGARRTPKAFSYVKTTPMGIVEGVSVKLPFTDSPEKEPVLVGTFYFSTASLLKDLLRKLLVQNIRVNNERYLDSIVEIAIKEGIRVHCFETEAYLNWGTPEALQEFDYWYRYFQGAKS